MSCRRLLRDCKSPTTSTGRAEGPLPCQHDDRQQQQLPPREHVVANGLTFCPKAVALLRRSQPSVLDGYTPISVTADGNCLFLSVSMAMYGTHDHHQQLRLLVTDEVRMYPQWYDPDRSDSVHPLRHVPDIVLGTYADVCAEVSSLNRDCSITAVLAVSAVVGYPIYSFWPPLCGSVHQPPLSRLLVGRDVDASKSVVNLMWSTTGNVPERGHVHINHFVPLIRRCVLGTDVDYADEQRQRDNDEDRNVVVDLTAEDVVDLCDELKDNHSLVSDSSAEAMEADQDDIAGHSVSTNYFRLFVCCCFGKTYVCFIIPYLHAHVFSINAVCFSYLFSLLICLD